MALERVNREIASMIQLIPVVNICKRFHLREKGIEPEVRLILAHTGPGLYAKLSCELCKYDLVCTHPSQPSGTESVEAHPVPEKPEWRIEEVNS